MDKGAHFFRCDFQVHTPRDANWHGGAAITDDERKTYANDLILACRRTGLDAIAITDHHDLAFFPYAKAAAAEELDDNGQPVPAEHRIVVFPGVELTLTSPTCQALLLLDADFPETLLDSVLTTLAINPAPSTDAKTANVQRIPTAVVSDLAQLYVKLNAFPPLKGRYIVLPNVTDSGYGTLLRAGFANYYAAMPCVGGYVDGLVSKLGTGNTAIVNGQNRDYGFKAIGVFQTSDNRRRDHQDLGRHSTWVKWSAPTAEALRQACLARESRIAQETPDLPRIYIASMTVSASKFLGRLDVDFNRQYNAIIGGRGTGKSTILEYLRWGLCDSVEEIESDTSPVPAKRRKLVADTLAKVDGEVHVTFYINDVRHIVKRNSRTNDILLRIADADFSKVTEQDVRNLLATQAYSQKQLSNVGVRLDELKRFVELPVRQKLDLIRSAAREAAAGVRSAYADLQRKRELEAEAGTSLTELASIQQQLVSMRASLTGLSTDDQALIARKTVVDQADTEIANVRDDMQKVRVSIQEVAEQLAAADTDAASSNTEEGAAADDEVLVERIHTEHTAWRKKISTELANVSALAAASPTALDIDLTVWDARKTSFDAAYEATVERAAANKQQLIQIREKERRQAELQKQQTATQNAIAALGQPQTTFATARKHWNDLHRDKVAILEAQCATFSRLSNGYIQATMAGSITTDLLRNSLKQAFTGMNVRDQRTDALCQSVLSAADPVEAWDQIVSELEKLSSQAGTVDVLPLTPTLDACGVIASEKARIVATLKMDRWLELAATELEFTPVFRYCTNKASAEYIAFADASAGQQATALLTVLLNQSGGPLIIDQPEDDVDSKMISDIVQLIWKAKTERQLIFASHNANFVVNGDAELVVCCDYVRSGDQTGGRMKTCGAIDTKDVRAEITAVTEGGEKAFKLRKEKYGF
jgi:chromosome segregation protein